jgi:hypothetical protein
MTRKRTTTHPRRKERQDNARERQNAYDSLSLDQKIAQQSTFQGKQYRKLMVKKEKSNA